MIKINTETNENIFSGQGKTSDAANAYVHALVKCIQAYLPASIQSDVLLSGFNELDP